MDVIGKMKGSWMEGFLNLPIRSTVRVICPLPSPPSVSLFLFHAFIPPIVFSRIKRFLEVLH